MISFSSPSKFWLNRECQEREDVDINIEIAPDSLNAMIHIKFRMMEMTIKKRKGSAEPVGEKKNKRARQAKE